MDSLVVQGPARLQGRVRISGSKNTSLPLLFSSLLFDGDVKFENIPRLWDIETTLKLLNEMGARSHWDKERGTLSISPTIQKRVASYEWVKRMRAGILALGPLVARYGEARVSLPGGCAIGARPVNYHIDALTQMGVTVSIEEGYIHAQVKSRPKGAFIRFPEVSVTGTENILIVAAVADGETVIENAAQEPEVIALGEFLKRQGARIEGLGTSRLTIQGTTLKQPQEAVRVPPDRIETGTWLAIALATRSDLVLEATAPDEQKAVLSAFRAMGARFEILGDEIRVLPADTYKSIEVETQPYPGFATDMQAQILTVLTQSQGTSRIQENIFENRFMHVAELRRLGAQIDVQGATAWIHGPTPLLAAPVMATDLRASACLVIAALIAKGDTQISRIYHLDRGYQRLDLKLQSLGARVKRIAE